MVKSIIRTRSQILGIAPQEIKPLDQMTPQELATEAGFTLPRNWKKVVDMKLVKDNVKRNRSLRAQMDLPYTLTLASRITDRNAGNDWSELNTFKTQRTNILSLDKSWTQQQVLYKLFVLEDMLEAYGLSVFELSKILQEHGGNDESETT